jgi:hypothetical protein
MSNVNGEPQVPTIPAADSAERSRSNWRLSTWEVAAGGALFGWFGVIAASDNAPLVAYLWPLTPLIAVTIQALRQRRIQAKSPQLSRG